MSTQEANVLAERVIKKVRPGSKQHLDSLRLELPSILEWQEKIKTAKGKEAAALRKNFKEKFGTTFNTELMEKLTGVKVVAEKAPEKLADFVEAEEASLRQSVLEQVDLENSIAAGLENNQDFVDQSANIDNQRVEIVDETVNHAQAVAASVEAPATVATKKSRIIKKSKSEDFDPVASLAELKALDDQKQAKLEEEQALVAEILSSNEAKETEKQVVANEQEIKVETQVSDNPDAQLNVDVNPETSSAVDVINPENQETTPETSRFIPEATVIFASLNLSEKDLESIPGLADMNGVSQLLIAKSLKSLALERARKQVENTQIQAVAAKKTWAGKLAAGIANTFRLGKQERGAVSDQERGGMEKHGADLLRLAQWAETFDLQEQETADGKIRANFINNLNLENLNDQQRELVASFNQAAGVLSLLPKHWLVKFDSVSKKSTEYKQAEQYVQAREEYRDLRQQMGDLLTNQLGQTDSEAMKQLNDADAKLNMIQLMAANPELEKEWGQMLKGSSVLKKALAKDNWKFLAGGFVGRTVTKAGLGALFGTSVSFVGVPIAAGVIAAWRARDRAQKQLRASDHFVDKKDIKESDLLVKRRAALKKLQALEPSSYVDDPKSGQKLEEQRQIWLQSLPPEDAANYRAALAEFNQAHQLWQEQEQEKTERKVLKAVDLVAKIELLQTKLQQASNGHEYELLLGQLRRRVDFNKDLANRGLVNFGSQEERTTQSLDFYQALSQAEVSLLGFDYNESKLAYERGSVFMEDDENNSGQESVMVERRLKIDIKERADDLLSSLEYFAEQKLDAKRRAFVKEQMWKGALLGGAFAGAGAVVGELSGHWLSDRVSGGFRFLKEVVGGKESSVSAAAITENVNASAVAKASAEMVGGETATGTAGGTNVAEKIATEAAANTSTSPETVTPAVTTPETWSNEIDHKGDSVWRSTRDIFRNQAQALGYNGDINDADALNSWAEAQTNQALANSGEVADKVFLGNQVILERSGSGFVVSIEAGSGDQPDFLPLTEVESTTVEPAAKVTDDLVPKSDYQPQTSPGEVRLNEGNREIWADKIGANFGFSANEVSYSDVNTIKTIMGGREVYINTVENTFTFIDPQGEEVSGFLAAEDGSFITDAKTFLADKFNLETIPDPGEANPFSDLFAGDAPGADLSSQAAVEDLAAAGSESSWSELSESQQLERVTEFLSSGGTAAKINSLSNNLGITLGANASMGAERLQTYAVEQLAGITKIADLGTKMLAEDKADLSKIINFISTNGYSPVHGRRLAELAAKIMLRQDQ